MNTRQAMLWITFLVALLVGCGDAPSTEAPPKRWDCPANWVAAAVGGCGPAVLLCVPDGGAAPGACRGIDLSRPPTIALPDGGTVRGFYRLPDGGIGGGWPEPGDPEGPPAEDWSPDAGAGAPSAGWAPDAGITTCAEGWRRLPDGTCDPVLRSDCPTGAEALPGGRCTPTSRLDCPATEYADPGAEAVGASLLHVRAGAGAAGADGSVERPFTSIVAAMDRAVPGSWLLLAEGTYEAPAALAERAQIHIVGVCAARVAIRPSAASSTAFRVTGEGTSLDLRGVTLRGGGATVSGAAMLRTQAVVVENAVGAGLKAEGPGTTLRLANSVIRDGAGGVGAEVGGVVAVSGATVDAVGVSVRSNLGNGVLATAAQTRMTLRASVVTSTRPRAGGALPHGITVGAGATLEATAVVVTDNTLAGIFCTGSETSLTLRQSIVSDSRPDDGGSFGFGIYASEGTHTVEETLVDNCSSAGIQISGVRDAVLPTTLTLTRSVVRRTRLSAVRSVGPGVLATLYARLTMVGSIIERGQGNGLEVTSNAVAEAQDSVVREHRSHGVEVRLASQFRGTRVLVSDATQSGVNTSSVAIVEINDSIVRRTRPPASGSIAAGLNVEVGSRLHATRVLIEDNSTRGVNVVHEHSEAVLVDCLVRRGVPLPGDRNGEGVVVGDQATLHVTDTLIADNFEAGASADRAELVLESCVVQRTSPHPDGLFGRGVNAQNMAQVTLLRSVVSESGELGVSGRDPGTSVRLESCVVRSVAPSVGIVGAAIGSAQGAQLDVSSTRIEDARDVGVQAQDPGSRIDLRDCLIQRIRERDEARGAALVARAGASVSAIGVSVQDCEGVGVVAQDEGSVVEFAGGRVSGVHAIEGGVQSHAAHTTFGASLRLDATLLSDNREAGLIAGLPRSRLDARDVLLLATGHGPRGLGLGVYVLAGATISVARVAIENVRGAAIVALPFIDAADARVDARDLFVRDVRSSTVRVAQEVPSTQPEGRPVAYGLHAGPGCSIDATRVVVDGGGFGFYNANGAVRVRTGVITNQLDAAGAIDLSTPGSAWSLDDVARAGNTSNNVVQRNDLPTASSLPAPSAIAETGH